MKAALALLGSEHVVVGVIMLIFVAVTRAGLMNRIYEVNAVGMAASASHHALAHHRPVGVGGENIYAILSCVYLHVSIEKVCERPTPRGSTLRADFC